MASTLDTQPWYSYFDDDYFMSPGRTLRRLSEENNAWLNLNFLGTAESFTVLTDKSRATIDYIIEELVPSEEYYIGICADPHRRMNGWYSEDWEFCPGHRVRWRNMFLIAMHDGPVIGQLEVAMLDGRLQSQDPASKCTNIKPGNQCPCPTGTLSFLYLACMDGRT